LSFTTSDPSGSTYYLRNTTSPVSSGKDLSTTQGSGTVTAVHTTINGPIAYPGDQWTATAGGSDIEWYTPALNSFTLGGVVKVVLGRGSTLEDIGTGADSLHCELAICNADGSGASVWSVSYTHYATSETPPDILFAHYITGPDTAVGQGKRLRLRLYSDDYASTFNQTAGTDRTLRYDGTSTYASRLIFTQSITEAPTGFAPPPFGARYRPQFTGPTRRLR